MAVILQGQVTGELEVSAEDREMKGVPSTERTRKLREFYMSHRYAICSERSVLVTDSYKSTEALPPVIRQAKAFAKVLREMPIWIQEGELIVSNIASRPRGAFLFPEYDCSWIEPELDTIATRATDPWDLSAEDKMAIKSCMSYWKDRNFKAIVDAITPDEVNQAMMNTFTMVDMAKEGGIGHLAPNIQDVVKFGLNDFIARAEQHIGNLDLTRTEDREKHQFLQAAIISLKAVIKWSGRFARLALEQAAVEQDPVRKAELEEIAEVCEWVPANPARNFREALQVAAIIMASVQIECNGVSIGTGRLDQFLLPYYRRDLNQGNLTVDRAVELMECMWLKFSESNRVVAEMICAAFSGYPFWIQMPIGGKTPDGRDATNDLSYLWLEVSSNMHVAEPTVSARVHNRTPDKFLIKCGEAVRSHGGGHPAMFNDEVIIPSQLANVPNMTIEDANDYSIIGCSEIAFAGLGTEGLAYQAISGGRMFEMMASNTDIWTGKRMADGAGGMLQWQSFDDVMTAYKAQARQFARFAFMQALPLVEAHNTHRPCPWISAITRDCIDRGKAHYDGGARYGNATLNVCFVAIATLGDSLMAIKKLVFDDKVLTTAQLKHALDTNFEDETTTPTGPEIQRLCKRVPKYGNDVPEVDLIARNCLDIAVKELRQYKTDYGAIYGTTVSPVTAHVSYGMICGATPDGRKAGTPLSDSVSPTQGADLQGPTASVKSVSNLAHMNLVQGTIYNLKMHPAAMGTRAGLMKWANLVRTYFDLGGWEVQFNVVDTEVLKDALEHPENHRNLVVRVVGYSAFFVELDRATQEDIIARTEHAF